MPWETKESRRLLSTQSTALGLGMLEPLDQLTRQAGWPPKIGEVPWSVMLTSRADRPSNTSHFPSVTLEIVRDCYEGIHCLVNISPCRFRLLVRMPLL